MSIANRGPDRTTMRATESDLTRVDVVAVEIEFTDNARLAGQVDKDQPAAFDIAELRGPGGA